MDPYNTQGPPAAPSREEITRERIAAAASAWAEAKQRTATWPAHLRADALREVADRWGGEPGTAAAASDRQAERLLAQLSGVAEPERGPVSEATRIAAERLLAGTQSAESEAHGRRVVAGR